MFKTSTIVITLFLFYGKVVFAQDTLGILKGNVVFEGVAVPYANIVLEGTVYGAISDENGNFILKNIPFSNYKLQISYVVSEMYTQEISIN